MNEETRNNCTPQEYILKLFEETENGKLAIRYFPILDQPYSKNYKMDWMREDAEKIVERYNTLTAALTRIGTLHDAIQEEAERQKLLTEADLAIWNTYLRPFEPAFEASDEVIAELYFRREGDSLEEEEDELLERHHEWFVANSCKRLPSDRHCPAYLINRAQRYEALVKLHAPENVIAEEGRSLAEEMVLYYHSFE